MTVNILGTEYTILVGKEGLYDGADGICDETAKRICVTDYADARNDPESKKNLDVQIKKVLRHEILHAFCFESGLAECSSWAQNEEMIDFIAIQAPKLVKAWLEAEALEIQLTPVENTLQLDPEVCQSTAKTVMQTFYRGDVAMGGGAG